MPRESKRGRERERESERERARLHWATHSVCGGTSREETIRRELSAAELESLNPTGSPARRSLATAIS